MREKFLSRQLFSVEELTEYDIKYQRLNEYVIPFFTTLLIQIRTRESDRSTKMTLKNSTRRALKKINQEYSDEIVDLVIRVAQLDGNTELDKMRAIASLQKQLHIFDRYSRMLKYAINNED